MRKEGYYSSGQFAKMAHVTLRTVRFYDKKNILKPSLVTDSGARFYTAEDFSKLQQILLLKYLGFSLDEIKDMLIEDTNSEMFRHSLSIQKKLIQDKIEQMQMVADSIDALTDVIDKSTADKSKKRSHHKKSEDAAAPNWEQLLELIHLTSFETGLKNQYQNAENISARIRLHAQYSTNKMGWFPWLANECGLIADQEQRLATAEQEIKILEVGCGNGELWTCRKSELRTDMRVVLSDISQGMVRDARRNIGAKDKRFSFKVFDAVSIPYEDDSFDLVIANHMLFYCEDIDRQLAEIKRVLKKGGRLICSTYGRKHMHEITEIVQEFDSRIVLSAENLFERFGLDDGARVLEKYFSEVECRRYDDQIVINKAEPLIEYIRSCHGNQNQYLLDRYSDFKDYISEKVEGGYHISKDAGVFISTK